MLAFLLAAYDEEEVRRRDAHGAAPRTRGSRRYKVAVLPLSKNETRSTPLAREVLGIAAAALHDRLRRDRSRSAAATGARTRSARRSCVTVDFDSLDDRAVTVRDRDTMAQDRVPIDDARRRRCDGRLRPELRVEKRMDVSSVEEAARRDERTSAEAGRASRTSAATSTRLGVVTAASSRRPGTVGGRGGRASRRCRARSGATPPGSSSAVEWTQVVDAGDGVGVVAGTVEPSWTPRLGRAVVGVVAVGTRGRSETAQRPAWSRQSS